MAKDDLLIGLDIGSDSVGWAATNNDFDLLRIKGKTAWGSRIFEAADNAVTRRSKRSARRRKERQKYRIYLLDTIFADAVNKVDDTFFLRLKNSTFVDSDKDEQIKGLNLLFKDQKCEKEYFKKYPTIWHLRKELLNENSNEYKDIRNVYLAIHHIIKYRGNFLSDGKIEVKKFDFEVLDAVNNCFNDILKRNVDEDEYEEFKILDADKYETFVKILENNDSNVTQRKKELSALLNTNADIKKYIDCFSAIVSGGSFDITKLDDSYEKISVCFDSKFDEIEDKVYSNLGDDSEFVKLAKQIFDHFKLKELLGNNIFLSDAFVNIYEAHKEQLKVLKQFAKEVDSKFNLNGEESEYKRLFKSRKTLYNYSAFVGVDSDSTKISIDDFNKELRKLFDKYNDIVESNISYRQLKYLASKNELLATIATSSTSLIPHQLHENELNIILSNAAKHYDFINNNSDKIVKLFKFRVPYFYGPLNTNSPYSNAVRVKNEVVTPWNFDEIFDAEKTREKFMSSLTNSCSYLIGEQVLPSNSIYYQKYIILNKLNTLSINGSRISNEIKKDVYAFVLNNKKTTYKGLIRFISKKYDLPNVSLSGLNEEDSFISDSYCLFKDFFCTNELGRDQIKIAESIILICAIYKDNINDAFGSIEKSLGFKLSNEQIKLIKSKDFGGWGRLSKKLLIGLKSIDDSGVALSILDVLEQTTLNFNQIIFDTTTYHFGELIDKENDSFGKGKDKNSAAKEIIDNLPAKFRRSVIQSVRIVDEVSKLSGKEPKYISIEVTRENDEKKKNKQTLSRYKELNTFINALTKDAKNEFMSSQAKHTILDLQKFENDESKLKSKHLYLYFKQNGIDLYTGKPIDINDVLNNNNKYDIDHIIPRHLRPDNSLDNMVLVDRVYNQRIKGGLYPIPEQIRCNPQIVSLWKYMHQIKAISDKKYNALIRATEFTDEELTDFVNSQINVVNQSNIALKNIFGILYKDATIIFSKAQYPSALRHHLKVEKLRELNDAHHAADAYLNIVSGVTLHNEYSLDYIINKSRQISDENSKNNRTFNMEKRLLYVLSENGLTEKVHNTLLRHDALITYREQYFDAEFYKETIHRKGKESLIPVHTNGPLNNQITYGGYEELKTSYFVIGEVKKGKSKKVLIDVPVLYSNLYNDPAILKEKLIEDQFPELSNDDIDIDFTHIIQPNQKITYGGVPYLLCSKGSAANLKLAYQLYLKQETINYLSFVSKNNERLNTIQNFDGDSFTFILNRDESNSITVSKKINNEIMNELLGKANQKLFDDCNIIQTIKGIADFEMQDLYNQLLTIFDVIKLFGRNARYSKFTPNLMTKSKKSLLNDNLYFVFESITGLCSYKRKA